MKPALILVFIGLSAFAQPPASPPPATPSSAAASPHAGDEKMNPKDGLTYIWIPPGKFTMGCSPGDRECTADERPAHEIEITHGFWLGQTKVTQEAFQRVTGKNRSHFHGTKLPVESVNWVDANTYCEAIGGRLPTEAEWEYAARAGSTGSRYGDIDRIAWYSVNSGNTTHEVRQKQPNGWGMYDVLGNVWEWTADWYHSKYYELGEIRDPKGPASGNVRVLRGGAWSVDPWNIRASNRMRLEPVYSGSIIGFRCVWESR